MKAKQIRFFSSEENSEEKKIKQKSVKKATPVNGYVSTAGKIVFPDKAAAKLGFDADNNMFKVGTTDGKRKIKSLFLIPAQGQEGETFELIKAAKSYSISLPYILQKGGIDYSQTKFVFTVKPFDYNDDVTGYELKLSPEGGKPTPTGKPRGRKPSMPVAE